MKKFKVAFNQVIQKLYSYFSIYFFEKSQKKWKGNPLKVLDYPGENYFIALFEEAKKVKAKQIDRFEEKNGFIIEKEWLNKLALVTQVVKKKSAINFQHGRILYSLLKNYLRKNDFKNSVINILETGTARGFSSLCLAKALEEDKINGKIFTFDVLPHLNPILWNCVSDKNGPQSRKDLLRDWKSLLAYITYIQGDVKITLPRIQIDRVHFAFLDGAHEYSDLMFEFNAIKNFQRQGDIIVFDDYTSSQFPGLVRAVDEICKNYNYSRYDLIENFKRGYVIATKK